MNGNIYYRLDIAAEIRNIFDRIDTLKDRTTYSEAIYNHPYTLSSVNWLYNDGIDKVFSQEYLDLELEVGLENWLLVLNHVIYQWLKSKGLDVVYNKFLNIAPVWSYLRHAMLSEYDFPPWYPNKASEEVLDKAIHENGLSQLFPKTFELLNHAYKLEPTPFPFIETKNISKDGISIPVSIHLDPLFLTITFIH